MRYIFLICLGLALPLAAQDIKKSTLPNVSIDLVGPEELRDERSIQISSNREGPVAQKRPDAVSITNQVQSEKAEFFLSIGLEYIDEGDYESAERAYQRALVEEPGSEVIPFRLGVLYVKMERFADAIELFTALLEKYPEDPLMNNNLAWCYATGPGVKNVKLALRHSREAILSAPIAPSMWNTLAEAYYLAGDYPKALRSSDQALFLLKRGKDPSEEAVESFEAQRAKILRAEQALKIFEGTLGE